jgi:hypothetical protein
MTIRFHCTLLILLLAIISCQTSDIDNYRSLVRQELDSKKKVNDIFFGISLGMSSKDFYLHCWDLNKKGLFTDGMANTSVLYTLNHNELKSPASMNFYPQFTSDGKIYKVWARFQYNGWMPWNKQLSSDSLLTDVLKLYRKWYPSGNSFITIKDPQKGIVYVKVDGNRQIVLSRYDDVEVKADYTDLSIPDQTQKN